MIRKVVASFGFSKPETVSFLERTAQVSEVRDANQHYHQQFSNRGGKKTKTAPLYGALAWTFAKEGSALSGLDVVTCWPGAAIEEKLSVRIPNPCGRDVRIPVGHICLQAFDHIIDLQEVTDAVSALINYMNTDVALHIHRKLNKLADEKGLDSSQLFAHPAGDFL